MAVDTWYSRQGDTVPAIQATVTGIDLRAFTTWKFILNTTDESAVLTEDATVVSSTATTTIVQYTWDDADTANLDGDYLGTFWGSDGAGNYYTIPKDEDIPCKFKKQLAKTTS